MLFDQCLPFFTDVRSSNGAELPSELDVGIGGNQVELANGDFHHGQSRTIKSLVLELDEEGVDRSEAIVGDEPVIVDGCQRLTTDLRRR